MWIVGGRVCLGFNMLITHTPRSSTAAVPTPGVGGEWGLNALDEPQVDSNKVVRHVADWSGER
jgi:hypothetical protein